MAKCCGVAAVNVSEAGDVRDPKSWAHLGVAKVADLQQRPRVGVQQRILQLDVPVGHTLRQAEDTSSHRPCSCTAGRGVHMQLLSGPRCRLTSRGLGHLEDRLEMWNHVGFGKLATVCDGAPCGGSSRR